MKIICAISLLLGLLLANRPVEAQRLRFDHAIIAVHDLGRASATFGRLGFTVAPGRRHDNGLTNRHVKFPNGTGLELMAAGQGHADTISLSYRDFLEAGEGGAYVALSGLPTASIAAKLKQHHVNHQVLRGRLWDYVVFAKGSGLEHLFFIAWHRSRIVRPQVMRHANGITSVRRIWIEGDDRLIKLLNIFSLPYCEIASTGEGRGPGVVYKVPGASLVVVAPEHRQSRRRFLGIGFDPRPPLPNGRRHSAHRVFIARVGDDPCGSDSGAR